MNVEMPRLQKEIKEEKLFYQNIQCMRLKKSRFIKKQEASGFLSSLGNI